MDEERTQFQKVILMILAAMIVLFGVLTGVSRAHKGVLFEETLLKVSAAAEQAVYSGEAHGDPVTITVTPGSGSKTTVEFVIGDRFHDICTVEYPLENIRTSRGDTVPGIRVLKNGAVLFEGGYDQNEEYGWYDQDGIRTPMFHIGAVVGNDPWSGYETTAVSVMRFAQGPELTARGSWLLYFLMVFLTLLLALAMAFPMTLFYIQHACDVRDPEPSDFYLATMKISWVVYPCLLLFGYIWALRQFP